ECSSFFFFFLAEDGIRDKLVTGVQTCALPIWRPPGQMARIIFNPVAETHFLQHFQIVFGAHSQPLRFKQFVLRFELDDPLFKFLDREERRVGKECRSRWWRCHEKKKVRETRSE